MELTAYHISKRKNRESILSNGIIPKEYSGEFINYGPSIFFSIDDKDLGFDFVDYENVDCWKFKVEESEIKKDTFSGSSKHFFIERVVLPSEIELFKVF